MMNYHWLIGLQFCALLFFKTFCEGSALTQHWSYSNPKDGPQKWSEIYKAMCSGTYQSPIDLSTRSSVFNPDMKKIQIYRTASTTVGNKISNTGHSVMIEFPEDTWFVSFDGSLDKKYQVVQMHFHWGKTDERGGEHTVDGKTFPLEGHIVIFRKEMYAAAADAIGRPGGLAVLGVLHKIVDSAKFEETIFSVYQNFSGKLTPDLAPANSQQIDEFDLSKVTTFLNPSRYFRYLGSLTTPPCTENVVWTVFTDPVPVTRKQLDQFRSLPFPVNEMHNNMYDNFRPVQPLNPEGQLVPRVVYRAAASSIPLQSLSTILSISVISQLALRLH
ncbi:unnamed protein product [Heterobilharzia americana]|nr:unnamed protein product [Heterobilharzia americana]